MSVKKEIRSWSAIGIMILPFTILFNIAIISNYFNFSDMTLFNWQAALFTYDVLYMIYFVALAVGIYFIEENVKKVFQENEWDFNKFKYLGYFLTAFALPIGILYWMMAPLVAAWAPYKEEKKKTKKVLTQKRVNVVEEDKAKDQFDLEAEKEVEEFYQKLQRETK